MPSEDDLFVNDDLSNSAENRLNHVLFGLFLKDEYRRAVLQRLAVAEDAIIYKPTNQPWGRPDFAIESNGGKILGYIEVELDKNLAQLKGYRDLAGVPVYSFGRAEEDHSITLEELVKIGIDILKEDPAPQFSLMVKHFRKQVQEAAGVRKSAPPMPVQAQLETPLGKALLKAGMVQWGEGPVRPGKLFGRTHRRDGISVRVFSPKSSGRTVGLFHITGGRREVRFASYSHLAQYLPDKRAALDHWADFIEQRLDGDIRIIGTRYHPVGLSVVEDTVDDMLQATLPLR